MTRRTVTASIQQAAARPLREAHHGELRSVDALYGYRLNSPRGDLSFDRRDSAPAVMKAVVTADTFHWGDDRSPNIPWSDLVIYEAHVRGLTMLREELRPRERGTFAALAEPGVIGHLRRLGVNAIELMPIHAFVQDQDLLKKNLRNYWGYNTLSFFAIEPAYLSDGSTEEMRLAVRTSMPPASRSSSTWSTITPPKAANSGRHFRFAASTMRTITASYRTIRGT